MPKVRLLTTKGNASLGDTVPYARLGRFSVQVRQETTRPTANIDSSLASGTTASGYTLQAGSPIGLLLALTYASNILVGSSSSMVSGPPPSVNIID